MARQKKQPNLSLVTNDYSIIPTYSDNALHLEETKYRQVLTTLWKELWVQIKQNPDNQTLRAWHYAFLNAGQDLFNRKDVSVYGSALDTEEYQILKVGSFKATIKRCTCGMNPCEHRVMARIYKAYNEYSNGQEREQTTD